MFMFNYGYAESQAMIIVLKAILFIGNFGLGWIIYDEFFRKDP